MTSIGRKKLLSFSFKNKKVEGQTKDSGRVSTATETEENLKHEMISSILKNNEQSVEAPVTFADVDDDPFESPSTNAPHIDPPPSGKKTGDSGPKKGPKKDKVTELIAAIESTSEKMIAPSIDLTTGQITYPILAEIGEPEENIGFLEELSSPSLDILDKTVYERFAVCPKHPNSLSVNIRLYCPRCSSMEIEKLHLIEHRRCGYISEKKNFASTPDGVITSCPSCKKEIRDMKKEIGIPAMWYRCKDCEEKFDDVNIKLYCRKHNHDFDMFESNTIEIPGYKLKNLSDNSNTSIAPILDKLKQVLYSHGFESEENYNVRGKSGNQHHVNVYGKDQNNRTVFIFVKNPNAESDNSELNSKIIEVLDTSPTVAILIGFPSISEKAKSITSNYNISLVTEQDPKLILSEIEKILSEKIPKVV